MARRESRRAAELKKLRAELALAEMARHVERTIRETA
jgi:hypothetical protein